MNRTELIRQIKTKNNFLCVGLDPVRARLPDHINRQEDPVFEFNRRIIDATAPHCVAYKPNLAFYEAEGLSGYASFEKTMRYLRSNYPGHFVIADAKRGDIGNTASMYARSFFVHFDADAVTVAPYMGADSVKPFLEFDGKWAVVLALTSNPGSADFQTLNHDGKAIFKHVVQKCAAWGTSENLMFVVGATKPTLLAEIRTLAPDHFFLVPGIGAQGGNLREVCKSGLNKDVGLLISASRSIIYASGGTDFAERAATEAQKISEDMKNILSEI